MSNLEAVLNNNTNLKPKLNVSTIDINKMCMSIGNKKNINKVQLPVASSVATNVDLDVKCKTNSDDSIVQVNKLQNTEVESKVKKNKLSEEAYAKKLAKKSAKKEIEDEEKVRLETIQKEFEEKAGLKASKARESAYEILFIEQPSKKKATLMADEIYNKVFNEELEKLKNPIKKQDLNKTILDTKYESTKENLLDDDSDDDEVIVGVPVENVTNLKVLFEDTTENDVSNYVEIKPKLGLSKNKYYQIHHDAEKTFADSILTESAIKTFEKILSSDSDNIKFIINVNTPKNLVLKTGPGFEITPMTFLKNDNYEFSKYLSRILFKKLNGAKIFVSIRNREDGSTIQLTPKKSK